MAPFVHRSSSWRASTAIRAGAAAIVACSVALVSAGPAVAQRRHHVSLLPSARSLVSEMKAAKAHVRSVHLVIKAHQSSPKATETFTQDSGIGVGVQHVKTGGRKANVILTKKYAYLSGNRDGLVAFFGLPTDDLALVGSKWITVKAGSAQYKAFVKTISVTALISNIIPSSHSISVRASTYHKRKTYVLSWTTSSKSASSTLHLVIPRSGRKLPIVETATSSTMTEHLTFTHWNKKLVVRAPAHTIASTKLHPT